MPDLTVLVVGAAGVGKSHFIRRALGLPGSAWTVPSSRKMLIGGVIYMVRLVELGLEHVDLDRDGRMRWPTAVDDVDIPHIDGALVLCDLSRPRSVDTVPAMLRKCIAHRCAAAAVVAQAGLPTAAVGKTEIAIPMSLLFVVLLLLHLLWHVRRTHSLSSAQLPEGPTKQPSLPPPLSLSLSPHNPPPRLRTVLSLTVRLGRDRCTSALGQLERRR